MGDGPVDYWLGHRQGRSDTACRQNLLGRGSARDWREGEICRVPRCAPSTVALASGHSRSKDKSVQRRGWRQSGASHIKRREAGSAHYHQQTTQHPYCCSDSTVRTPWVSDSCVEHRLQSSQDSAFRDDVKPRQVCAAQFLLVTMAATPGPRKAPSRTTRATLDPPDDRIPDVNAPARVGPADSPE